MSFYVQKWNLTRGFQVISDSTELLKQFVACSYLL